MPNIVTNLTYDSTNYRMQTILADLVIVSVNVLVVIGMYQMWSAAQSDGKALESTSFFSLVLSDILNSYLLLLVNPVRSIEGPFLLSILCYLPLVIKLLMINFWFSYYCWRTINHRYFGDDSKFCKSALQYLLFLIKYCFVKFTILVMLGANSNSQYCLPVLSCVLLPQIFKNTREDQIYRFNKSFVVYFALSNYIGIAFFKAFPISSLLYKPMTTSYVTGFAIWLVCVTILIIQNQNGQKTDKLSPSEMPSDVNPDQSNSATTNSDQIEQAKSAEDDSKFEVSEIHIPEPVNDLDFLNGEFFVYDQTTPQRTDTCKLCLSSANEMSLLMNMHPSEGNQSVKRKRTTRNRKRNDFTVLQCSHTFHADCLKSWVKERNDCPECGVTIGSDS